MSAHVLLILINELRKSDKTRGLWSILSLFRNEFNKFKNALARMYVCLFLLLYVPSQQLWSLRDGQFT